MSKTIVYKHILMSDGFYQQERELRNRILLRPIGVPDFGWEMKDKESEHFVAVEGETVVGCVILNIDINTPTSGRLMQMAVDDNLQGKGIGKQLVMVLTHFAKQKGLKEITCHARKDVVSFYSKLGFVVYGKTFEEAGILHEHMRIDL